MTADAKANGFVFARERFQEDRVPVALTKRAAMDLTTQLECPDWEALTEAAKTECPHATTSIGMALVLRRELDQAERIISTLRERLEDLSTELSGGYRGTCEACNIESEIGTEDVPHPIDARLHACRSIDR